MDNKILVYKNIPPQQTTNNTQRLMKRKSNGTTLHSYFFFSYPFVGQCIFVEKRLKIYYTIYQTIVLLIQLFTLFQLQQVHREINWVSILFASWLVGRISDQPTVRPADQRRSIVLAKREGLPITADTPHRLLRNRKSHSSLGHFLNAVQAPLKTPQ